jgi:hypothetical protein
VISPGCPARRRQVPSRGLRPGADLGVGERCSFGPQDLARGHLDRQRDPVEPAAQVDRGSHIRIGNQATVVRD